MLKIDHLTSDRLTEVFQGARLDSAQAYHLKHCGDCRRTVAASLLVGRLGRASSAPIPGPHVDSGALAQLHAEAFEFEELGGGGLGRYLATLRHLNQCDVCFARFFALHQSLTPTEQAVQGAISRFERGQRLQRAGTLRITRTLEKLRQTFLPAKPAAHAARGGDDRSLAGAVARLTQDEADNLVSEDRLSVDALLPPAALSLDAQLSMEESIPRVSHFRISASVEPRPQATQSAEDLLEAAEEQARQLASLMQEGAAELASFRKGLTAARRPHGKEQTLPALMRDFEHLNSRLERFRAQAPALTEAMSSLKGELDRIAELEQRLRTQEFVAMPEYVSLPDLTLAISTRWRGDSGVLTVVAQDPETDAPRPGIELIPQVADYVPASASVLTDSSGRARIPLHAGVVGLRVVTSASAKPWLINIEVEEQHPLR